MTILELTFNEQLLITALDKCLFALLILFAGFLFNKVLERYKAGQNHSFNKLLEQYKALQSLNHEVFKLRASAMNDTWTKMYMWVHSSNNLLGDVQLGKINLEEAKKKIRLHAEEVTAEIEKNRFLTGNQFSDDCLNYGGTFGNYFEGFNAGTKNAISFAELKKAGEGLLSSLDHYLNSNAEKSKFEGTTE